ETNLRKPLHHLRAGECLGQKHGFRVLALYFADHPLPEREGFRVRIVDAEDSDAMADPEQHDIAQRMPKPRDRLAVEVDIDDVLILLRRVLVEFDGAVRTPVEPFRMLLDPRMIGRALDRKIERDLDVHFARCFHQTAEILEAAKLGMDGIVAAIFRTYRLGADMYIRTSSLRHV